MLDYKEPSEILSARKGPKTVKHVDLASSYMNGQGSSVTSRQFTRKDNDGSINSNQSKASIMRIAGERNMNSGRKKGSHEVQQKKWVGGGSEY